MAEFEAHSARDIAVGGMTCGGCASRVSKLISRVIEATGASGVEVVVNVETERARFSATDREAQEVLRQLDADGWIVGEA